MGILEPAVVDSELEAEPSVVDEKFWKQLAAQNLPGWPAYN